MKFGGAQPLYMENKKLVRFVSSFLLLPVMSISSSSIGPTKDGENNDSSVPQIALIQKGNIASLDLFSSKDGLLAKEEDKIDTLKIKGDAIDAYFKDHEMPLFGQGKKMAEEAEKNDLDWRLIAAISVRESTGGKFDCKKVSNNPFGWGSCKIGFKTVDEAIETIGRNLGGNNPNTAHHYDGKTTKEILQKYNPPSVVKHYAEQVMQIMDDIADVNLGTVEKIEKAQA